MPKTFDVINALEQGNRAEAGKLLQQVLKENPDADAWYIAATLTSDKKKKLTYARNALSFNSKHRKARALIVDIEGGMTIARRQGQTLPNRLVGSYYAFLERIGFERPALFAIVVAIAIIALAVVAMLLLSGG